MNQENNILNQYIKDMEMSHGSAFSDTKTKQKSF